MSYDIEESAGVQAQLVELYDFSVGVLNYRYTSGAESVTPDTATGWEYISEYIERGTIGQHNELAKDDITITVHRDNTVAALYHGRPPDQPVTLIISRYHDEGLATEDIKAVWVGSVLSCEFDGLKAKLHCESTLTSLKRAGLWRKYSGSCSAVLYDSRCGVESSSYQFITTVSTISSAVIDVVGADTFEDDYFTGGYLNWLGSDGNVQSRMIFAHTGTEITMDWLIDGLGVSDQVELFPGCKHTSSDCWNKYQNTDNYRGFPFIPEKNPHTAVIY